MPKACGSSDDVLVVSDDDDRAPRWFACLCKEDRVNLAQFMGNLSMVEDAALAQELKDNLQVQWKLTDEQILGLQRHLCLEDDASQPEDEEKEDDAAGIGEATKDCEVIAVDGEEGESESPVGESATDGGDEDAHAVADADSEGDRGMEELNTVPPC
jgi:hypothetical protein